MIIPIKSLIPFALAGVSLTCSLSVAAQDKAGLYVTAYGGSSTLASTNFTESRTAMAALNGEGDFGGVETGLGNGGEAGGEELVADAKWAMDEEMFAGKVFAAPGACVDVGVCDNAEETWRGGCEVRGDGVGGDVPFIFCQSHCADVYIGDGV
jgi:hypothetical protein